MRIKEALKATLLVFFLTAVSVLFAMGITELASIWSDIGAFIVFVVVVFVGMFTLFLHA